MHKNKKMGIVAYYHSLRKGDKSKFLSYLSSNYGIKSNTIIKKFSDNSNYSFTLLEEKAIEEAISKGLWRQ